MSLISGALEDCLLFDNEFGECLKDAVNNYLGRKLFQILMIFDSFSEEERKSLIGYTVEHKSFREIGKELNRDHKTIQARYYDAVLKIKNSPLVNVTFRRQHTDD